MLVFVYGTLLRKQSNHRLLARSEFVSTAEVRGIEMFVTHGAFPYCTVTQNPDHVVKGELFSVDERTLDDLDALEGVPTHYKRITHPCRLPDDTVRDAFMYVVPYRAYPSVAIGSSWAAWRRS